MSRCNDLRQKLLDQFLVESIDFFARPLVEQYRTVRRRSRPVRCETNVALWPIWIFLFVVLVVLGPELANAQ
jgi:hypothetical protein